MFLDLKAQVFKCGILSFLILSGVLEKDGLVLGPALLSEVGDCPLLCRDRAKSCLETEEAAGRGAGWGLRRKAMSGRIDSPSSPAGAEAWDRLPGELGLGCFQAPAQGSKQDPA